MLGLKLNLISKRGKLTIDVLSIKGESVRSIPWTFSFSKSSSGCKYTSVYLAEAAQFGCYHETLYTLLTPGAFGNNFESMVLQLIVQNSSLFIQCEMALMWMTQDLADD